MIRAWLIAVLFVAGCKKPDALPSSPDEAWLEGRALTQGTPVNGGTLTIRLPLEPAGLTRLHDRFAEGTMTRITVGPVYETLAGRLADKWSTNDEHTVTTIELKKGIKFHDGTPFTSGDVKATLEVILAPDNASTVLRTSLDLIDGIETPDPHRVIVRWSRPSYFSEYTLVSSVPIMPAHALEGEWDTLKVHRAPIGTGPFRFEKWEPGVSLSYVKADDRAHVQRVVFRFVKDEGSALRAWERGEFDVMTRLSPANWRAMEKQPWSWQQYQRVRFSENTYSWIGFNQRHAMFRDVDTRRALAMLYPAELIAKNVTLDLEPATTCPYFPGSQSCDPEVEPIAFEPEAAKELLKNAGWKDEDDDGVLEREGQKFTFSFLVPAQSVRMAKLLPIYLDVLKDAGIDAHIETVDVSAYMSRVRPHDFDAMALSWSSPTDVQDNFQNFHSSQRDNGSNFVGYSNPEVDVLLEKLRVTWNPEERIAMEREVHRRVYADQAYLFLTRTPTLDAFRRNVQNVKPSLAWYDLSSLWISK